ncbi:MAG: dTDP-4-dehydrorhamnose reductase [uncultured Pyrinomonadaceae bacterium]|uniref:dTDP-4-dehydrorhamnose reductase n=1 Tax=uncultured Pyrinomonadaceae bacterium TaxID=2283094 RepID=A0A6J4Q444_9BACT|nr:MAG: dTDP-4-dehydrorhamnose reductase [uncultured Pyrinomonadaceae bacterium]
MKHIVRANVEAMLAVLDVRPDALFIQSESSEYTHGCHPDFADEAEMLNERKFLSLDLNYGRRVSSGMYEYLRDNGMSAAEYEFFLRHNLREHCILGNDYYASNELLLIDETTRVYGGDIFSYYVLTKEYYERFNLPVMNTETNMTGGENAVNWMWKIWANIQRLRHDGVPVCGMTWYSLIDQIDWDTALREDNNRVHPVGLFDLDRQIRPVGEAYRKLIEQWSFTPLLPNGPLTLIGEWNVAAEQEKYEDSKKYFVRFGIDRLVRRFRFGTTTAANDSIPAPGQALRFIKRKSSRANGVYGCRADFGARERRNGDSFSRQKF